MIRTNFIFLILILLQFGCQKEKSVDNIDKQIFEQVYLNLVDSTYQDGRLYLEPIPKGISIENRRLLLEKDNATLVFAIDEPYGIDLESYNTDRFSFRRFSTFPRNTKYEIWETKYNFAFAGALSFSKIKFDKKNHGVIEVNYGCGTKCGFIYRVLIKKQSNKWFVEKVIQTGAI